MIKIIIILFALSLSAVEEGGQGPFFQLKGRVKLELDRSATSICRVKTKNVITYKKFEKKECSSLDAGLSPSLKKLLSTKKSKKETIFLFVQKGKESNYTPKLITKEGVFKVQSIIHNRKKNSYQIELLDDQKKYFFYIFQPQKVEIAE